jgi:hypothetical protein
VPAAPVFPLGRYTRGGRSGGSVEREAKTNLSIGAAVAFATETKTGLA